MTKTVILSILLSVSFHEAYALDQGLAQQCAVDICGPAEQYLALSAEGAFATVIPEDVNKIIKETEVVLRKILGQNIQQLRIQEAMIKRLSDRDLKSINSKRLAFFKVIAAFQLLFSRGGEIVDVDRDGNYKIDKQKAEKQLPHLNKALVSSLVDGVNVLFASSHNINAENSEKASMEVWFRILHTAQGSEGDFEAHKRDYLDIYIDRLKHFQKIYGNQIVSSSSISLFEKAKRGSPLSDYEKKKIMRMITKLYQMMNVDDEKAQIIFADVHLSATQLIDYLQWKDISELIGSPKTLNEEKEKTLKYCRRKIVQYFSTVPSILNLKNAEKWFERVKIASKKVSAKYLSGTDFAEIEKNIDKLRISPQDIQSHETFLKESLSDYLASVVNEVKQVERSYRANDFWTVLSQISLNSKESASADDNSRFKSVVDFCESLVETDISDGTYPSVKEFKTSWQSIRFPEIGMGVVAHEIGHIVSRLVGEHMLARQGYSNVFSCSTERHEALLRNKDFAGTYRQYREEDWADEFAVEVVKELKPEFDFLHNPSCAMLARNKKMNQYESLELTDPRARDTHSMSFLRVLRAQVGLGLDLPQSCKKMLGPELESIVTKRCE